MVGYAGVVHLLLCMILCFTITFFFCRILTVNPHQKVREEKLNVKCLTNLRLSAVKLVSLPRVGCQGIPDETSRPITLTYQ